MRSVVLVVDDDPGMLRGVERLLKAHGLDAAAFASAEDLIDRADFADAVCLVLDIHLNGMSGIELRRRLALSGVSLPVIFMTANDSEATRNAAVQAGCLAYLRFTDGGCDGELPGAARRDRFSRVGAALPCRALLG
jgi:FixJ family two-component response regulator